jgi:hypothetical protein
MTCVRTIVWLAISIVLLAKASEANQAGSAVPPITSAASPSVPSPIHGPPAPVSPDVIARDEAGRATIRAVRLTESIRVDARLDEGIYQTVPPISDLIQQEPHEGSPATEQTELWILFDRDHIYVSFRCWESHPERLVANEMRRDNNQIYQNDHIAFVFDTFYDRRNAVEFLVNPIGGRMDGQITNERQYNGDWNPVWDVAVGRFQGGWTAEAAIPFKSLRYRPDRAQTWGFNARRLSRWKNEWSYLTRIPAALAGLGIFQVSLAATIVGLEIPPGARNLEVKPYAISNIRSDLNAIPRVSNDLSAAFGVDAKYGITRNLMADLTVNTDFAQVEADEQQVNLTRFNLFFPEKREFFLENQGTFSFGGSGMGGPGDTPILFYSRRIGLNEGRVVPIPAGGRLTGRLGRYSLGLLTIQSGEDPASAALETNFSVVRVKRDILRRSSIGVIATGRSVSQTGVGSNAAYGVDGTFAFFDNLAINTYWARTHTDDLSGADTSYRAHLDYAGDRYGVQLEHLFVGNVFNPEVGFVRRRDVRRSFGQFRFSPRPRSITSVRKFSWTGSMTYIENGSGRRELQNPDGEFQIQFQNSDVFRVGYGATYEFVPQPFRIAPGVTLPVGGYDYSSGRIGHTFGPQRRISGTMLFEYGTFYTGHKTSATLSSAFLNISPRVSMQPSVSVNWVNLVEGSFVARLIGSRITYTMTPLMFVSALVQYNSDAGTVSTNARLRWEYRAGSELFLVYNDERDTLTHRFPVLRNRAVIVKINRLFRF